MIIIVYHCYLVGNWEDIVTKQLSRLKKSKLYDKCDEFHMTINLSNTPKEKIKNVISNYDKIIPHYFTENNAEYPAIKKIKDISSEKDAYFFYFHSKGVSNDYEKFETKKINRQKIKNIESWKNCLEYFLIDKWEDCIENLKNYDTVGVTCVNGWYWGNFWWTKSSHLKKTIPVKKWSRWEYEAWLNKDVNNVKNYEFFHFNYNPYLTFLDEDFYINKGKYKGSEIILRSAKYGTPSFEIDEGYSGSKLNTQIDAKKYILEFLNKENNKKLNFTINNETMGGDPIFGCKKFLMLEFSPSTDLSKIYNISLGESEKLNFEF